MTEQEVPVCDVEVGQYVRVRSNQGPEDAVVQGIHTNKAGHIVLDVETSDGSFMSAGFAPDDVVVVLGDAGDA